MTNQEIKQQIAEMLFNRGIWTKRVDSSEIRTRCPFCGDSTSNQNIGKLYIRINPEDNLPMIYHCFRCEESGVVTPDVLSMLELDSMDLKEKINQVNNTSDKISHGSFSSNLKTLIFDYKVSDQSVDNVKIRYIENRLGISLKEEDIKRAKIITSFKEFLIDNDIDKITCDTYVAQKLEDNYVGFLSFGASYIMFRDITEKEKFRWIKYPITKESKQSRCFYSMSMSADVLSPDPLIINLSEGILDILSANYTLGHNKENEVNIAVCGKGYTAILEYLASIGFVGSNITVNIFADNDKDFNKNGNEGTTIKYFKKVFKNMKYLYKDINVYYNIKSKDIGVAKDNILLEKHKV